VKVDTANDDHTEGNDHRYAACNCAADCSQQQQSHIQHEINHISWGFVCISNSTKQGVVGRRLSVRINSFFIWWWRTSRYSLMSGNCARNVVIGRWGTDLVAGRINGTDRSRCDSMFYIRCVRWWSIWRMNSGSGRPLLEPDSCLERTWGRLESECCLTSWCFDVGIVGNIITFNVSFKIYLFSYQLSFNRGS